ncbi:MAG: 6-phosphogluconolactonase [Burkholderiales bacterium]|nr:6-phosphogluconolactonase [Burkholderiales bacterium]
MVRWQWLGSDSEVRDATYRFIEQAAQQSIAVRGAFHLVLAGGSTPRAVYQMLPALATDWSKWHLYYGDERVLPADHPDRNSKMAADAWLSQVPIPFTQIHPMPTEQGLVSAAAHYADLLAAVDQFDLVLLGLGEDGHTASLFPGHEFGTQADAPDVLQVEDAPKPPPQRLSLSARRLSAARQVLFIVTGAGKREAVARWKQGEQIPAATIHCDNGVDVLLDRAAWSIN